MWTIVSQITDRIFGKYKWVKWVSLFLISVVILIIFAWPQKIGDMRTKDGVTQIYYRGPNPSEPGRWVPLNKNINKDHHAEPKADGDFGVIGTFVIVDLVKLSNGRCIILLDDDTAAIIQCP